MQNQKNYINDNNMNRQVIMHAVAFLLSLFCVTLNAQEIKFHYEDIRHGDIRYNYIVNDLGYFDKFHGEQNCRIHNGKNLESDFAITYDQGVPISFSIEARGIMPPFYTQGGLYSEGDYDKDGISVLSSYCSRESSSYANPNVEYFRDHRRAISLYRVNNKVAFVGKIDEPARKQSNKYFASYQICSYGLIDESNCSVIILNNNEDHTSNIRTNYILFNNDLYEFSSYSDLLDFIKQIQQCSNTEDLNKISYFCYKQNIGKKDIDKIEAYNSVFGSYFGQGQDLYDGFLKAQDYPFNLSTNFFYMTIGNGRDRLVFDGLNLDLSSRAKNIYYVRKKKVDEPLAFMTREQYEKYKDQLEYNAEIQRHGIKKADGTYLYAPYDIEATIVKSNNDIELDKQEEKKKQVEYVNAQRMFSLVTTITEQQKLYNTHIEGIDWLLEQNKYNNKIKDTLTTQCNLLKKELEQSRSQYQKELDRKEKLKKEIDKALSQNNYEAFDLLLAQCDDKNSIIEMALLAADRIGNETQAEKYAQMLVETGTYDGTVIKELFLNSIDLQNYEKASVYSKYLKSLNVPDDWYLKQLDMGHNINAAVYNVKYSNDSTLAKRTVNSVISGIKLDRLLFDDYSYIVTLSEELPDIFFFNVLAALISANNGNHLLASSHLARINNFDSFNYQENDQQWSLRCGTATLLSDKICAKGNVGGAVLLGCAILDKIGKSVSSFRLCTRYVPYELVNTNWNYYSAYPGVVTNAILNGKEDLISNSAFIVPFLESLKSDSPDEYLNLFDDCYHHLKGTDPHFQTTYYFLVYAKGFVYMNSGQYKTAIQFFKGCNKFGDYKDRIKECKSKMK